MARSHPSSLFGLLFAVVALTPSSWAVADGIESAGRQPRQPLRGFSVEMPEPLGEFETQLVVKFHDDVRARIRRGALTSSVDADLAPVLATADRFGSAFSPLIRLPEDTLRGLEMRAAERSGRAQPDLAGMMIVRVEPTSQVALGRELDTLSAVEFAYIQAIGVPPPGDIAPPTPDHVSEQDYRGPDPGIDADHAASLGYSGAGIRLSDCEYAWVSSHEDLEDVGVVHEPGQTTPGWVIALGFDEHGTAVLGETSAPENGYGVSGMAPGAEVYVYPEWSAEEGERRVTSIAHAIAGSAAGDVVLLEMQTSLGGPAEADPAVWTVVRTGADAGVIVVGAAGNGTQDLDGPAYADYRALGHSGALIVGAGTADTNHDMLSFSSFGTRVDLQGWGVSVFTIGYGDFAQYGGDKNQRYTSIFSGTSSASPFVTSAVLLVQEAAVGEWGVHLSATQIGDLLKATGIPQGSGGEIGPFVDLRAALDSLRTPPDLGLVGSCPGTVELTLSDLTPSGEVALVWSRNRGIDTLPVGPCRGAEVGIDGPALLSRRTADANGRLSFEGNIPAGACGAFAQAIDLTTCAPSDVASAP